jgi:hypothetical protein
LLMGSPGIPTREIGQGPKPMSSALIVMPNTRTENRDGRESLLIVPPAHSAPKQPGTIQTSTKFATPTAFGKPWKKRSTSTNPQATNSERTRMPPCRGVAGLKIGVSAVTRMYEPRNQSSCVVRSINGAATRVGASQVTIGPNGTEKSLRSRPHPLGVTAAALYMFVPRNCVRCTTCEKEKWDNLKNPRKCLGPRICS